MPGSAHAKSKMKSELECVISAKLEYVPLQLQADAHLELILLLLIILIFFHNFTKLIGLNLNVSANLHIISEKTNNLPLIFKKHHKTTEDGILILLLFFISCR